MGIALAILAACLFASLGVNGFLVYHVLKHSTREADRLGTGMTVLAEQALKHLSARSLGEVVQADGMAAKQEFDLKQYEKELAELRATLDNAQYVETEDGRKMKMSDLEPALLEGKELEPL